MFRGAIVFDDGLKSVGGAVSYTIRMVDEFHDTGLLFPIFQLPGPNAGREKCSVLNQKQRNA